MNLTERLRVKCDVLESEVAAKSGEGREAR